LLKHDYVIMPVETVRWLEMVFGEGLSADEATQRIADGATEAVEGIQDMEIAQDTEATVPTEDEEA